MLYPGEIVMMQLEGTKETLEAMVELFKDGTQLYSRHKKGIGQAALVMAAVADTPNCVVYKVLLMKPRDGEPSRGFVVEEDKPKALKVFCATKGVLGATKDQLSELKMGKHIARKSPHLQGFLEVGLIGLLEEAGAETMQPVGCALMELAESTLQSHLEGLLRDQVFVQTLARAAGWMVAGLQRLQEIGILHLDIKGPNYLVMEDGRVVLADWGLAQDMSNFIKSVLQMRQDVTAGVGEFEVVPWFCGSLPHMCPQLGGMDQENEQNKFMDRIVKSELKSCKRTVKSAEASCSKAEKACKQLATLAKMLRRNGVVLATKEAAGTLLACDKWSLAVTLGRMATPKRSFVEDAIRHRDGKIKVKDGPDYGTNLQIRFYEIIWEDECNGTPGECILAGLASAGPTLAVLVGQVLLLLLRPCSHKRATYEELFSTPLLQLALPCLPKEGNSAEEHLKELLQRAANLPKSPADLERASAAAEAVKLLYVKRSADDVRAGQPSPCAPGIMQKPFYQNLRLFTPWRKGTQGTEELQQHQERTQLAPAPSENSVAVHPPTETGAGSNPRDPQGCSSKASSSGDATATSTANATLPSGAGAASAGGGAGARGASNYGGGPSGAGGSGRCGSPINLVDPEPDTAAMFAGLKMVFPREGGAGSVDLTPADLACLDPKRFLNDNLIDFYLKWVELTPAHSRFYFFNSFFYTKLSGLGSDGGSGCSNGVGSTGGSGGSSRSGSSSGSGSGNESGSKAARKKMRKDAWARRCAKTRDRVKEYTKGVDIFAKDFLLVPIFYKSHWSLAIVCHPGLFAQRMQQMAAQVEQHHEAAAAAAGGDGSAAGAAAAGAAGGGSGVEAEPVIIHLDSLCGTADGHHTWIIVSDLRCWLKQEFLAQQQQPEQQMPTYSLGQLLPSCKVSTLPKQNNGCDCGLFTLAYVERFVHANPPALSRKAVLDKKMALSAVDPRLMRQDWFHPTVATCMRGHLRHMLLSMMLEQATDKTLPGVAAALADTEMYKHKQELLQEYVQHHQEVHPVCGYVAPGDYAAVRQQLAAYQRHHQQQKKARRKAAAAGERQQGQPQLQEQELVAQQQQDQRYQEQQQELQTAGKKRARAAGAAAASAGSCAGLQPAPAEMMAGTADPGPDRTGQEDDAHSRGAAKRQRLMKTASSRLAAAAAAGQGGKGAQVDGSPAEGAATAADHGAHRTDRVADFAAGGAEPDDVEDQFLLAEEEDGAPVGAELAETKRMLKCLVAAWASSRGRKKQGGNAGAGQAADDVQVDYGRLLQHVGQMLKEYEKDLPASRKAPAKEAGTSTYQSQHALTDIILPEQLHNCVAVLTATAGQSCTALPTGIYSCTVLQFVTRLCIAFIKACKMARLGRIHLFNKARMPEHMALTVDMQVAERTDKIAHLVELLAALQQQQRAAKVGGNGKTRVQCRPAFARDAPGCRHAGRAGCAVRIEDAAPVRLDINLEQRDSWGEYWCKNPGAV
ncbi:hypothetical protein OEZ86_012322 [Tetradesmus obliquus]|nr:hypothetical protein OEZ86_012322 [Tetradesmus obliquus]